LLFAGLCTTNLPYALLYIGVISSVICLLASIGLQRVAVSSPLKCCCNWHALLFYVLQVIGGGILLDTRRKEGIELLLVVLLNVSQVRHICAACAKGPCLLTAGPPSVALLGGVV
jgi:hypothetical protein